MRRQRDRTTTLALAAMLLLGARTVYAENIDPADDGHQFAWQENVGWVNAEPQGPGGPGAQVADFALSGWLWGENIGWVSLSCANTASCGSSSYGVTNDGFGVLSGFAWSENAGWLSFRPAACAPDPTCGVRIDPATGYFSGRAWGENIGWLTFSSGAPIGSTVRTSWCAGTLAPPGAGPVIHLGKNGQETVLTWPGLAGASWFDVVGGNLGTLRATSGDFSAATQLCVIGRLTSNTYSFTTPAPALGNAQWFVARGANCRGRGTYDSGSPRQLGSRDAEIEASTHGCP